MRAKDHHIQNLILEGEHQMLALHRVEGDLHSAGVVVTDGAAAKTAYARVRLREVDDPVGLRVAARELCRHGSDLEIETLRLAKEGDREGLHKIPLDVKVHIRVAGGAGHEGRGDI